MCFPQNFFLSIRLCCRMIHKIWSGILHLCQWPNKTQAQTRVQHIVIINTLMFFLLKTPHFYSPTATFHTMLQIPSQGELKIVTCTIKIEEINTNRAVSINNLSSCISSRSTLRRRCITSRVASTLRIHVLSSCSTRLSFRTRCSCMRRYQCCIQMGGN